MLFWTFLKSLNSHKNRYASIELVLFVPKDLEEIFLSMIMVVVMFSAGLIFGNIALEIRLYNL